MNPLKRYLNRILMTSNILPELKNSLAGMLHCRKFLFSKEFRIVIPINMFIVSMYVDDLIVYVFSVLALQ